MLNRNLTELLLKSSESLCALNFIHSSNNRSTVSYFSLLLQVRKAAKYLEKQGIKPGDELIFQFTNNEYFITVFWAALYNGIIPVPIHPATNAESRRKLENVWSTLNRPYIIAEDQVAQLLHQKIDFNTFAHFHPSRFLQVSGDFSNYDPKETHYDAAPEDLAFIQFSSGSTGSPKGVRLSHQNLLCNIEAIIAGAQLTSADSTLAWMPLTHDLGLIGFHLTPMACGIDQHILFTDAFVRRPSLWVDLLHETKATFTASPNFGYKHFLSHARIPETPWDLSAVKRILNGAEPISADLARDFLAFLQPFGLAQNTMFPVYGMAEASLAITFPVPDENFKTLKLDREQLGVGARISERTDGVELISVGKPVLHTEVALFNFVDESLADEYIGQIKIRGKNVTKGYYNNATVTQQTLDEHGWLNTGDLGVIHEDELYIVGRSKDIIFANGLNLYPHDLERIAEESEQIQTGRVVFTGAFDHNKAADRILCFVVFRGNLDQFLSLAQAIKQRITKRIAVEIDHVIPVQAIPKTTSGKIQRFQLTQQFLNGDFEVTLNELEILQNQRSVVEASTPVQIELLALWNQELDDRVKGIHDNFFEFGGNSLKASMLRGKIAKQFHVDISIRELFKNPTIASLEELISTKNTEQFEHIPSISERKFYPCSSTQKRLYLLHQINPDECDYNITSVHEIQGELQVEQIERVLNKLVKNHAILRTNFGEIEGEPVQYINETSFISCPQVAVVEEDLDQTLNQLVQPFNLLSDQLLRVQILRVSPTKQFLFFDIHHIILDGYSLNQLVKEFNAAFKNEEIQLEGAPYTDFAVWEKDFFGTSALKKQQDFWLNEFQVLPEKLEFPTDVSRLKNMSNQAETIRIILDKKEKKAIDQFIEQHRLTHFQLFLACYAYVLHRYCAQTDFVIGTPVINRPHLDVQHTLGSFINTLPFRIQLEENMTVAHLLQSIQQKSMDVFSNQNYPFDLIVQQLHVERELNRNPLFDVFFVYQNANELSLELEGLVTTKYPLDNKSSKFDLNLHVYDEVESFELLFEFNAALYQSATIKQFGQYYQTILKAMCAQPTAALATLNWIDGEPQTIGRGAERILSAETALDQFILQVQKHPSKTALVGGGTSFSYQNLDQVSTCYAEKLIEQVPKSKQLIGISFHAVEKVIPAILACWKAGHAYVPIDPTNPSERNEHLISDAEVGFIFTDYEISNNCHLSDIDFKMASTTVLPNQLQATDTAYVIYTSGTTGKPKGTLIPHRALVNYTDWIAHDFGINEKQSALLLSSYAFDLGYTSIFGTLLKGGCLHVLTEDERKESSLVLTYLKENEITYFKTTPSQFFTLLQATNREEIASLQALKTIFIGGEAIKTSDLREWQVLNPSCQFINHYGPTEATIGCVAKRIDDLDAFEQQTVIGQVMSNAQVVLLDRSGKAVPPGIKGELCISGKGLAKEYHRNPEQTAEKFITHNETRYYRTGDLAKFTDKGELILYGRNDDQVKIRGYRVELGEVEKNISHAGFCEEVLLLASPNEQGHTELLAYLIAPTLPIDDLKLQLAALLPAYMLPSHYVVLEQFPLTANGKLDKKRLPKPEQKIQANSTELLDTFTSNQQLLAEIWKDLLVINELGLDSHFFQLGGHSLKANILVSRIHKAFEVELRLKEIFENPLFGRQITLIEGKEKKKFQAIVAQEKRSYYPTSSAQQRMFVLHEIQPESLAYNMSAAFVLSGDVNLTKLNRTFNQILERHEILRSSFSEKNDRIVQYIHENIDFVVEELAPVADLHAQIKQFIRAFDLKTPCQLRVGLAPIAGTANYLLVIDMHHIVSDGTSMGILVQDFIALYESKHLDPLKIQYRDFAVWQENFLNGRHAEDQKTYWINKFSNEIPLLELQGDYPRPTELKGLGSNFSWQFDAELSNVIHSYASKHGSTLFITLCSFYALLLSKKTQQNDFVIGTPVAGRFHSDLEGLMGVFLNMAPLLIQVDSSLSFPVFLSQNQQQILSDFENQHYPFDQLANDLKVQRSLNRNPLFDTMLVVQNMDLKDLETSDLTFNQVEFDMGSSQLDLSLVVFENGGVLDFDVQFNTELFKEERIRQLMSEFELLIRKVIANDELPLSQYDLLTDGNRQDLLKLALETQVPAPLNCLTDRLVLSFSTTPDKQAVLDFDRSFTYSELEEKVARVQAILDEAQVRKGQVVGVYMRPEMELVPIVLGILFSGAVYLPLDTMYPEQRIEHMLTDSNCQFLFFNETNPFQVAGLSLNDFRNNTSAGSILQQRAVLSDPAYIIYTSGTTGKPKGVLINHTSLADYIACFIDTFGVQSGDCILQLTSISFDTSLEELFSTLVTGGKIFMVNQDKDLNLIGEAIATGIPTILTTSPLVVSFLNQSLDSWHKIRKVLSGGEELKLEHFSQIPPEIEVWNGYGPTEATVYITMKKIDRENPIVNLGKPIRSRHVFILDRDQQLLPYGSIGELCVSGLCLAQIYLNSPELTAEKFIPHPCLPGERLYRTGDLSYWNARGELEFLGRMDAQIKIRGYRIELREIELELLALPEVSAAVVVAPTDEHENTFLCAYCCSSTELKPIDLKTRLAEKLPNYMIPDFFIQLDHIPITPNGKLDRKALPLPERDSKPQEHEEATSAEEQHLVAVWKTILKREEVSVHDHFFELGGDSIKAILMVNALRKLQYKLEVKQVFEARSLRELALKMLTLNVQAEQGEIAGPFELTPMQEEFFSHELKQAHFYNQSLALKSEQPIDEQAVFKAYTGLLAHHDNLRSLFPFIDGERKPYVQQMEDLKLEEKQRMIVHSENAIYEEMNRLQANLKLDEGVLFTYGLIQFQQTNYLLFVAHHLIVDAVSWRILMDDFMQLYQDREALLAPKTDGIIAFSSALKEFAHGNQLLEELPYWQKIAVEETTQLFPTNWGLRSESRQIEFELNFDDTQLLLNVCNQAYNTRTEDLLLTALGMTLTQWKNAPKLRIEVEGHGREQLLDGIDTSRSVAWFTTLYPIVYEHQDDLGKNIIKTKDRIHLVPNRGFNYLLFKYGFPASGLKDLRAEVLYNFLGEIDQEHEQGGFALLPSSAFEQVGAANELFYAFEMNQSIAQGKLQSKILVSALVPETELAHFEQNYQQNLAEIIQFCKAQELGEITQSDLSFEIDSDDFENIFNL